MGKHKGGLLRSKLGWTLGRSLSYFHHLHCSQLQPGLLNRFDIELRLNYTEECFFHLDRHLSCIFSNRRALDIANHRELLPLSQCAVLHSWEKGFSIKCLLKLFAINIKYQENEKEEEHFAIFAPFSQACGLVLTQASKQELHSLQLLISQSTIEFINELKVKGPTSIWRIVR